jgi:hypothetical protein
VKRVFEIERKDGRPFPAPIADWVSFIADWVSYEIKREARLEALRGMREDMCRDCDEIVTEVIAAEEAEERKRK